MLGAGAGARNGASGVARDVQERTTQVALRFPPTGGPVACKNSARQHRLVHKKCITFSEFLHINGSRYRISALACANALA